jgi:hypothetical protein
MLATEEAARLAEKNRDGSNDRNRQRPRSPDNSGNQNERSHQDLQKGDSIDADGFNVSERTPIVIEILAFDDSWLQRVTLPTDNSPRPDGSTGVEITRFGIDPSQLQRDLFKVRTLVSITKRRTKNGRLIVRMEFQADTDSGESPAKYREPAKGILIDTFKRGQLSAVYHKGKQKAVRLRLENSSKECSGDHTPQLEDDSLFLD